MPNELDDVYTQPVGDRRMIYTRRHISGERLKAAIDELLIATPDLKQQNYELIDWSGSQMKDLIDNGGVVTGGLYARRGFSGLELPDTIQEEMADNLIARRRCQDLGFPLPLTKPDGKPRSTRRTNSMYFVLPKFRAIVEDDKNRAIALRDPDFGTDIGSWRSFRYELARMVKEEAERRSVPLLVAAHTLAGNTFCDELAAVSGQRASLRTSDAA